MRDSASPPSPSRDATVSEGTGLLQIGEFAQLDVKGLDRYFRKQRCREGETRFFFDLVLSTEAVATLYLQAHFQIP